MIVGTSMAISNVDMIVGTSMAIFKVDMIVGAPWLSLKDLTPSSKSKYICILMHVVML
jgi:hypothetical protein